MKRTKTASVTDWTVRLRNASGLAPDRFLDDEASLATYGTDWTRMSGKAGLVALPRTKEEVAAVLAAAYADRIPVVPSGGRTGLAGGATAPEGELVLSLERLRGVGSVDRAARSLRVEAGATNAAVQEACAPLSLHWPVDLGSRGTATIGGNLSTNAGGLRVLRYGTTRRWVLGVEALLVDGTPIERLGGLEKYNCGYDWGQLLVGSEGTLAVIVAATLKLARLPKATATALFALDGWAALPRLLERARTAEKDAFELWGFEFFSRRCLDVVMAQMDREDPFSSTAPCYALVEYAMDSPGDGVPDALVELATTEGVVHAIAASSGEDRKRLWGYRENITEALQRSGLVRKFDCSIPVSGGARFLAAAEKQLCDPEDPLELFLFGHFGDGSPHVNFAQPSGVSAKDFQGACDRAEDRLFDLLDSHSGHPSAEHGIGRGKLEWMRRRPEAELTLQRALKTAFDPLGLLNPGKVLP